MVDYANWLSKVNDDKLISSLSLPGTHNSAAYFTALPSVQCQDASIEEQLKHGVRFFDIRVSKNIFKGKEEKQKDLVVIHGKFPVKLLGNVYLKEVLDDIYKDLNDHKSETVIVSIKQEGSGTWDNDNDEFGNLIWNDYVNKDKNRWYLKTDIPRLRDARGKVVLLRRFGVKNEDRKREFGIDAAWWKYNCTHDDRGHLQIQDWCEISSVDDIQKKASYIKNLSQSASKHNETNSDDPKLFINFCSGSNFFDPNCWPSKIAKGLNENRIDESFARGSGIIILDYAEADDWKLVKSLVDKNF